MHPFSRPYTTPLLLLMSVALVVAQMLLSDANAIALWVNWLFAGLVAAGIWHITRRYHLCGIYDGRAITISWPLLCAVMNFTLCFFPRYERFYLGIVLGLSMLLVLTLILSAWQGEMSVKRHLLVGIIIGLTSTLLPHTLLWLLLLPMTDYHMRSWSVRNAFGTLTGTALGIWTVYVGLFVHDHWFTAAPAEPGLARQMLLDYAVIVQPENFNLLSSGLGLWQWLFLGLIALLVIIYSISALLLNVADSVRAGASVSLISTLSISMVVFSFFDVTHLGFYICLLAFFLSIQLTIHMAHLRHALNQWWTLIIILAMLALSALPVLV